ncbi:MAG TPA: sialidase family protein, partial [Actinopolymorphaceae bacterium]
MTALHRLRRFVGRVRAIGALAVVVLASTALALAGGPPVGAAAAPTPSADSADSSTLSSSTLSSLTLSSSTVSSPATAPQATGRLLRDGTGLYPRVIRLEHNGAANGRVLAGVVSFVGEADGIGAIYESTDDGATFTHVGTVADPEAARGQGLCCATLFELPRQIGTMPAGTLLWAASVGASDRPMSLRIWKSQDLGRTWSYLSACATAPNTGGLWEPEFSVAGDGHLVCHYADETDPTHSQKLMRVRSSDGTTWVDRVPTVASPTFGHRPGMPVVRALPNGEYVMTYEVCGLGGQYDCVVHIRRSPDGWSWGTSSWIGSRPETVDGKYFTHTPTIAWGPSASNGNGRLMLIGQILQNRDGSVAA